MEQIQTTNTEKEVHSPTPLTKRVSNRSITCSQKLHARLRIMAAHKGVPMQHLLEKWVTEKLEEAGF